MAQGDYHIYIHQTKEIIHKRVTAQKPSQMGVSKTGGSNTRPREAESTSKKYFPSQVPGSSVANSILRVSRNGASIGGVIGVAVAAAKATEQAQKAIGKMNDYTAAYTGDYSFSIAYQNYAQYQHNIMHPISGYIRSELTQSSWARANRKVEEQRSLLGDTAINTLTKGV